MPGGAKLDTLQLQAEVQKGGLATPTSFFFNLFHVTMSHVPFMTYEFIMLLIVEENKERSQRSAWLK